MAKDYTLYMQKCMVLKEMLLTENEARFAELRIHLRRPVKSIPYFGTINGEITRFAYAFKQFKETVMGFIKVAKHAHQQAEDGDQDAERDHVPGPQLRHELHLQHQAQPQLITDGPGNHN